MTTTNPHAVTVELKDQDDYRSILSALDKAALRAANEIWEQWRPYEKRRITFEFDTGNEAEKARGALSPFLAGSRLQMR